ncbi:hypothetical protein EYR36_003901 [Pleurotus pulmonarius]|nr:hypothetical protein EYR36_003901 [Pleurotus pulmonarius]
MITVPFMDTTRSSSEPHHSYASVVHSEFDSVTIKELLDSIDFGWDKVFNDLERLSGVVEGDIDIPEILRQLSASRSVLHLLRRFLSTSKVPCPICGAAFRPHVDERKLYPMFNVGPCDQNMKKAVAALTTAKECLMDNLETYIVYEEGRISYFRKRVPPEPGGYPSLGP